jgi:hypothetical protein
VAGGAPGGRGAARGMRPAAPAAPLSCCSSRSLFPARLYNCWLPGLLQSDSLSLLVFTTAGSLACCNQVYYMLTTCPQSRRRCKGSAGRGAQPWRGATATAASGLPGTCRAGGR